MELGSITASSTRETYTYSYRLVFLNNLMSGKLLEKQSKFKLSFDFLLN